MRKTKTVQSFPTDNIKDYGEGIRLNPFFLRFGGDNNEAWCSSDWAGKHANPMFPSGEITVAQRMIATLHKSGVTQIAVITGPDDKKMEKQLAQYGVYFLQNPQPEKEDASIDMGLRYLSGKCEWIYLMDADRPLLDPDSLVDLLPIHPLQSDFPICTTSVLLLTETTFLPPT